MDGVTIIEQSGWGDHYSTHTLNALQTYECYTQVFNLGGPGYNILSWSTPAMPEELITADNFATSEDVGNSPYQIIMG